MPAEHGWDCYRNDSWATEVNQYWHNNYIPSHTTQYKRKCLKIHSPGYDRCLTSKVKLRCGTKVLTIRDMLQLNAEIHTLDPSAHALFMQEWIKSNAPTLQAGYLQGEVFQARRTRRTPRGRPRTLWWGYALGFPWRKWPMGDMWVDGSKEELAMLTLISSKGCWEQK